MPAPLICQQDRFKMSTWCAGRQSADLGLLITVVSILHWSGVCATCQTENAHIFPPSFRQANASKIKQDGCISVSVFFKKNFSVLWNIWQAHFEGKQCITFDKELELPTTSTNFSTLLRAHSLKTAGSENSTSSPKEGTDGEENVTTGLSLNTTNMHANILPPDCQFIQIQHLNMNFSAGPYRHEHLFQAGHFIASCSLSLLCEIKSSLPGTFIFTQLYLS